MLIINGKEVKHNKLFAYDGCHKIYVLEDSKDLLEATNVGYDIYQIDEIEEKYNDSCEFRFISNWKLTERYVEQFEEEVTFEYNRKELING